MERTINSMTMGFTVDNHKNVDICMKAYFCAVDEIVDQKGVQFNETNFFVRRSIVNAAHVVYDAMNTVIFKDSKMLSISADIKPGPENRMIIVHTIRGDNTKVEIDEVI